MSPSLDDQEQSPSDRAPRIGRTISGQPCTSQESHAVHMSCNPGEGGWSLFLGCHLFAGSKEPHDGTLVIVTKMRENIDDQVRARSGLILLKLLKAPGRMKKRRKPSIHTTALTSSRPPGQPTQHPFSFSNRKISKLPDIQID